MKVAIVGAGIGGLAAAIALQQQGMSVIVYEAVSVIQPLGAGVGLASNAILALSRLGISDNVIERGKRLTALQMLDESGNMISNQETVLLGNQYRENNLVIHRADLHEVLLKHLQPETLVLDKRCVAIKQHNAKVMVTFSDGTSVRVDFLIAADGIHSAIRQMLVPSSTPRFAGYTCWRAVIANPGIDLNSMVSAETWTRKGRFGMAALPGNRIYWYACVNASENDTKMKQMTPKELALHFAGMHAPIADVLNATKREQLIWNDIADIKPLKKFAFGRILLLGDAAHATTPNMGQGACQAIEDAVVLSQCLLRGKELKRALQCYEKRRLARTKKIIQLSRFLGWVAHWEQPVLCEIRNRIFRLMPKKFTKKQLQWLFHVDF